MSVEAKLTYDLDEETLKKATRLMAEYGKEANLTDKEIEDLQKSLKEMGSQADKSTRQAKGGLEGLGGVAKKIGPAIVAAFAADKILDFAKQVIEVTARFEKMEAVLRNTLGSNSQARLVMTQIQDFASKTNFSVSELTDAWIKLANQGFQPTMDEMRKLADIANSTGKEFDQLAEAIIDAQVGEFERLKEFGIRAQKEGDRVTFTFKGVKRQVDFTSEAIQAYVLSLGEVEGVSGSTEKISKTLGGAISNLGDSFEKLLMSLGSIASPIIIRGIEMLGNALSDIADTLISDEQKSFNRAAEIFKEMGGSAMTLTEAQKQLNQLKKEQAQLVDEDLKQQLQVKAEVKNTGTEEKALILLKLAGVKLSENEHQNQVKITDSLEDNIQLQKILSDFIKQQKKDLSGVSLEYNKIGKELKSITNIDLGIDTISIPDDAVKKMFNSLDAIKQKNQDTTDSMIEQWKKQQEVKREIFANSIDIVSSGLETIYLLNEYNRKRELEKLEIEYNTKLDMVGQNNARREEIEKEYAQKKKAIDEQRARDERRMFIFDQIRAIGDVVFNTQAAVAKARLAFFATGGEPWASYLQIQGAISAGLILAQSIPAFKDGTERVNGEGGEREDKILARLGRNERVIDAQRNKRIGFNMSNEELTRAAEFYRAIPYQLRGDLWQAASSKESIDLTEVVSGLKEVKRQIERQPGVSVTIDSHGHALNITRQQSHQKYLQDQFGIRIK